MTRADRARFIDFVSSEMGESAVITALTLDARLNALDITNLCQVRVEMVAPDGTLLTGIRGQGDALTDWTVKPMR